jgi:hypothetical protein
MVFTTGIDAITLSLPCVRLRQEQWIVTRAAMQADHSGTTDLLVVQTLAASLLGPL